jgi:alpha/beta superfamily hydrolase
LKAATSLPRKRSAPIAIVLHPHPQFGGTMNNQIVYQLFYMFQKRGFTTLRFNFRSIGRSQGEFDHGTGELSDAAAALDWVQSLHPDSKSCWVAGYSFGCLDRHAAPDAPPGDRRLHVGGAAAEHLTTSPSSPPARLRA